MDKKTIIQYSFNTADLFYEWEDEEEYDEAESTQRYADKCEEAIREAYPGTEVEIICLSGATGQSSYGAKIQIDDQDDDSDDDPDYDPDYDPECDFIEDICARVWQNTIIWLVELE